MITMFISAIYDQIGVLWLYQDCWEMIATGDNHTDQSSTAATTVTTIATTAAITTATTVSTRTTSPLPPPATGVVKEAQPAAVSNIYIDGFQKVIMNLNRKGESLCFHIGNL
jgi:hypothetical protein